MRLSIIAAVAASVWIGAAGACDDHVGKCEIEAWRYIQSTSMLTIEGSATCDEGRAYIRLYDGTGPDQKFLGIAEGPVENHALSAWAREVDEFEDLAIKYSIEPR